MLRFAAGAAVFVVAITCILIGFFGLQNWRIHRAWAVFQRELAKAGRTLDVSAFLPGPVPDDRNFARAPVFQNLLNQGRAAARSSPALLEALRYVEAESGFGGSMSSSDLWSQQNFTAFKEQLGRLRLRSGTSTNRLETARLTLEGLEPESEMLAAIAAAAQRPFFQSATNRDASAVMQTDRPALSMIERLQFLFQLRACARAALDRTPEAADDVLTSLRMARLAPQSPDARAAIRAQFMVTRSLQPIWEGLAERRWNAEQLEAFQTELARFHLLANHTNSIQRVVMAYIELWRTIPAGKTVPRSVMQPGGNPVYQPAWPFLPRAWWLASCVQLYEAGQTAVGRVDVPGNRVSIGYIGSDMGGLSLDGEFYQVLQGSYSWTANPASVAFAQTALNQAIIACALERYRLAHGAFPESLEPLLPAGLEHIPNDVVRGRPMIYQRLSEDRFILRGVGPNETDDRKNSASDDWLWMYPGTTNAPAESARDAKH